MHARGCASPVTRSRPARARSPVRVSDSASRGPAESRVAAPQMIHPPSESCPQSKRARFKTHLPPPVAPRSRFPALFFRLRAKHALALPVCSTTAVPLTSPVSFLPSRTIAPQNPIYNLPHRVEGAQHSKQSFPFDLGPQALLGSRGGQRR